MGSGSSTAKRLEISKDVEISSAEFQRLVETVFRELTSQNLGCLRD
jgi:hypothetical protein